jgi:hypothetical protein
MSLPSLSLLPSTAISVFSILRQQKSYLADSHNQARAERFSGLVIRFRGQEMDKDEWWWFFRSFNFLDD